MCIVKRKAYLQAVQRVGEYLVWLQGWLASSVARLISAPQPEQLTGSNCACAGSPAPAWSVCCSTSCATSVYRFGKLQAAKYYTSDIDQCK